MFAKEYRVKGELVKGQIVANWSVKSQYAFKVDSMEPFTFDEESLGKYIKELQSVYELVKTSNKEYKG
ncbi:hypothetical protein [uncultured Metabacillus sp.]|uniref:hypothetical protein n=1 Tax=Metabacillus sp. Hm71 TaxID=3450743 RepID=UPI0026328771|nr:hypothetical protein [uncultured Metabacillus sp.]